MTTEVPGGVVLSVRVIPRARRSGLGGTRGNALLVRLTAPPVEGAANSELIEVIARTLGVATRAVSIVSGERGRLKRVKIDGITLDIVNSKLKTQN